MPLPPAGLSLLHVAVSVDHPALIPALRLQLNPLAIALTEVTDLPGIVLPEGLDRSLHKYVEPTKFSLQQQLCGGTFATFRLFDGDDLPRVVRTLPCAAASTARWNHKSVFLLGHLSPQQLQQHIISSPVQVEVHDRDRAGPCGRPVFPAGDTERWEAALRGGGAITVFDVDETVVRDIEAALSTAGDDNPHGVASVSLAALLSRSNERRALLKQAIAASEGAAQTAAAATASVAADAKERLRRKRAAALKAMGMETLDEAAGLASHHSSTHSLPGGAVPAAPAPAGAAAAAAPATGAAAAAPAPAAGSHSRRQSAATQGPAEPVWEPGTGHDTIELLYTADVAARKKRVVPKVVSSGVVVSEGERLLLSSGAYSVCGTRVRIRATLARPLHEQPPYVAPPKLLFTRAALCMKVRSPLF